MNSEVKPKGVSIVPAETHQTFSIGAGSPAGTATPFELSDSTGVAVLSRETEETQDARLDPLEKLADEYREHAEFLRNSAQAWHKAGFAYLAADNAPSAAECFEASLIIQPKSRIARLGLARAFYKLGESAKAHPLLNDLISEKPNDIEPQIAMAVLLATESRFGDALELLNRSLDSVEEPPANLLATRGGLQFGLGDYRGAVGDLRKAIRRKPDWVHVRNLLALSELRLGRKTAAERHLREALRVGPLSLAPLLNLAGILRSDERWEDVLDLIDKFWSPISSPIQIAQLAGEASLATDNPRRAVEWLEGAAEKARNPNERSTALNNLGVAYSNLRKLKDADQAFVASTEAFPNDIAIANRARVLLDQGHVTEATEWLSNWSKKRALGPGSKGTLAWCFAREGRSAEAIALATELAERESSDVSPFLLLTALYADMVEDPLASVKAARLGLERFPKNARLLNNLAYALLQAGEIDQASDALDLADISTLRDKGHVACLTATKGLLALKRGDFFTGRRLYEEAAAIAPATLREQVKAKRDLETARFLLQAGRDNSEAIHLLERATQYDPSAEPFVSQAGKELKLLRSGDQKP